MLDRRCGCLARFRLCYDIGFQQEQRTIFGGWLLVGLAAIFVNAGAQTDMLLAQAQNPAEKAAPPEELRANAAWEGCINAPTRRCVLGQALRITQSTTGPSDRPFRSQQFRALLSVAEAQARIGLSEEAGATFAQVYKLAQSFQAELAKPLSYIPFVNLVTAMARAGLAREARETAQSFKDEVLQGLSQQSIAEAQARAGMIREARETAQSIQDEFVLMDVRLAIAQAQAAAGLIDEARTTARFLQVDSYRAEALASIAEAETAAGHARQAAEAFSHAIVLAQEPKYDSVFASIAGAQARAGLNDDAHKTVQSIQNDPIRAEALASIAQAEARAGLAQQAAVTFGRAIETAQSIKDRGLRSEAHSAITRKMARAGLFQEAIQAAETLDYERSNAIDSIAVIMAETGRVGDAIKTAQSFSHPLERARTLARIAIVLQQ